VQRGSGLSLQLTLSTRSGFLRTTRCGSLTTTWPHRCAAPPRTTHLAPLPAPHPHLHTTHCLRTRLPTLPPTRRALSTPHTPPPTHTHTHTHYPTPTCYMPVAGIVAFACAHLGGSQLPVGIAIHSLLFWIMFRYLSVPGTEPCLHSHLLLCPCIPAFLFHCTQLRGNCSL